MNDPLLQLSTRVNQSTSDRKVKKRLIDKLADLMLVAYAVTIFLSGTPLSVGWVQVAFGIAALVCAACSCALKKHCLHLFSGSSLLTVFVFYCLLCSTVSGYLDASNAVYFARLMICVLMVLLFQYNDIGWYGLIVRTIIACATVHALVTIAFFVNPNLDYAFYQPVVLGYSNVTSVTGPKAGLATHYSTNGMFLALGVMATTGPLLSSIRSRENVRWLYWLIFFVLEFALMLTTKRAHFIFSIIVVASVFLISHHKRLDQAILKLASIAIMAVVLVFALADHIPQLSTLFDRIASSATDESFGGRKPMYDECIAMWEESPVLGLGWGSFAYRIPAGFPDRAHNVFLQLLAETGVIGLALFLGFVLMFIKDSVAIVQKLSDVDILPGNKDARWSVSALAILLFFLVYCITGNPIYDSIEYIPFFLSCAYVANCKCVLGLNARKKADQNRYVYIEQSRRQTSSG